MGGSVKSNAAASQSSGRRGILLSLVLSLVLMFIVGSSSGWQLRHSALAGLEQTECPHALMKMRLPDSRLNFDAWKTKTVTPPRPFRFN